jgi:hypothetical protein
MFRGVRRGVLMCLEMGKRRRRTNCGIVLWVRSRDRSVGECLFGIDLLVVLKGRMLVQLFARGRVSQDHAISSL